MTHLCFSEAVGTAVANWFAEEWAAAVVTGADLDFVADQYKWSGFVPSGYREPAQLQQLREIEKRQLLQNTILEKSFIRLYTLLTSGRLAAEVQVAPDRFLKLPPETWRDADFAEVYATGEIHFVRPEGRLASGKVIISVHDLWSVLGEMLTRADPATLKGKPGAKGQFDWEDVSQFIFQELDSRGDFDQPENQSEHWKSAADLCRMTIAYIGKHNGGREPGWSTVKQRVRDAVCSWRSGREWNSANPSLNRPTALKLGCKL
jgi:hypothetical protein